MGRYIVAIWLVLLLSTCAAHALLLGGGTPQSQNPTTIVWSTPGQVNSNGTTSLVATRGSGSIGVGNCVLVAVNDGGTPTVADNATPPHTYAPGPTAGTYLKIFTLLNAPAGGGTQITVSDSGGTVAGVFVNEYSHCGISFDTAGSGNSGTTGTALTSNNVTTTQNGDLIWGAALTDAATTALTPGTGFTGLSAGPTSAGSTVNAGAYTNGSGTYQFYGETEALVQSTAGAVAATFSQSVSGPWQAAAIAITPYGYTPPLTINSVSINNTTFTVGTAGTVGALTTILSTGSFTGSYALVTSGTDHAGTTCNNYGSDFSISSSNLNFSGSAPAQSYPGVCISATQSGASNSPYTQAFTLTGTTGGGSGVLTLTNGPPNIPYASAGSCTTSTCTWIQAGISGEAVSDVYLDLTHISQNYTGTFTLSGPNASNYSISTASDGTRNVGHITTASSLSAGDDDVTVNAGSNNLRLTIHKVSGVVVGCGSANDTTLQNDVNANGAGTIFLLGSCTYNFSNDVVPNNNDVFIGVGCSSGSCGTILDGGLLNGGGRGTCAAGGTYCNDYTASNVTGVAVMGQQIQNFGANNGGNWGNGFASAAVNAYDNWVVRNNVLTNNTGMALIAQGSGVFIANNLFNHNGYDSIKGQCCENTNLNTIIGNEITDSNFGNNQTNADAGNKWGGVYDTQVTNNYYHDNCGPAWWADFSSSTMNATGNTFIHNSPALVWEISNNGTYSADHNAFIDNGGSFYPLACPGTQTATVWAHGTGNITIQNNYFSNQMGPSQSYGQTAGGMFDVSDDDCRTNPADTQDPNEIATNNTVIFRALSDGGWYGEKWGTAYDCQDTLTTGSNLNNNAFHYVYSGASIANDGHFAWRPNWTTLITLAAMQSTYSFETSSTADTTDPSPGFTGCTHEACSGSGIGPGGVPQ